MHQDIKDFLTTYGEISLDEVSGNPRKWNGTDHDDEWWIYRGVAFYPAYTRAADKNVRVCYSGETKTVGSKSRDESVSTWIKLGSLGVTLSQYKLLSYTHGPQWEINEESISRNLVCDLYQTIELFSEAEDWLLKMGKGELYFETFEEAVMMAEYQVGAVYK